MKRIYLAILALSAASGAFAQEQKAPAGVYDQHETFNPYFYTTANGNEYRSASGAPGPKYWQNRADYKINVKLDTVEQTLSGTVSINYKNNSPDKLGYVWLQLDQNIYRKDSRSEATTHTVPGKRWASPESFTGGYDIKKISIQSKGKLTEPEFIISDTRVRINLPKELKAGGDSVNIVITYSFPIPEYGTDRMGRKRFRDGWVYEIAQWFPRLAVYDDIHGWDTLPYLGAGEFYLEYGNLDYTITAPSNLIIVGSGGLLNATEVLAKPLQERLRKAAASDATVAIRTEADFNNPGSQVGGKAELSWHFKINNSRDVAWAASKAFLWDAARINLPSGKKALAQAVYPAEAKGPEAWGGATESVKQVIEYYSNKWFEYPYPVATNVGGSVGGMEYPGLVFCHAGSGPGRVWGVTNHEFGHNWFPMIVGSNERRHTFMDEGFDTFINGLNAKEHNAGLPAANGRKQQDIYTTAQTTFGAAEEPSVSYEDVLQFQRIGTDAYRKPALALSLLRSEVIGEKLFDLAFKNYIREWAFKHPTPDDFFRSIENGTGEDLGWFWRSWFFNTWKLDQAVTGVTYVDNDPSKGAVISIKNLEKIVMPVTLDIKETGGKTSRIKLPVEVWQRGADWNFNFKSGAVIESVTIDPDHKYPDINPANNVFKPATVHQ
ncbi:MAG: M1 family metallopeptidase [Bacteroidota bacterium]